MSSDNSRALDGQDAFAVEVAYDLNGERFLSTTVKIGANEPPPVELPEGAVPVSSQQMADEGVAATLAFERAAQEIADKARAKQTAEQDRADEVDALIGELAESAGIAVPEWLAKKVKDRRKNA